MKLHAIFWELSGNNCNTRNYITGKKCWLSLHEWNLPVNRSIVGVVVRFQSVMTKVRTKNLILYATIGTTSALQNQKRAVSPFGECGVKFSCAVLRKQLLPRSMEHSPSSEAKSPSVIHEIIRILRNPRVHYRPHKNPPLVRILIQINSVHALPFYFLKTYFNVMLPSTPESSK